MHCNSALASKPQLRSYHRPPRRLQASVQLLYGYMSPTQTPAMIHSACTSHAAAVHITSLNRLQCHALPMDPKLQSHIAYLTEAHTQLPTPFFPRFRHSS